MKYIIVPGIGIAFTREEARKMLSSFYAKDINEVILVTSTNEEVKIKKELI